MPNAVGILIVSETEFYGLGKLTVTGTVPVQRATGSVHENGLFAPLSGITALFSSNPLYTGGCIHLAGM